jgi:uncharacterized protein
MDYVPAALAAAAPDALFALCRRYGARQLDLFGSAANGRFDPEHSDLDFLVDFGDLEGAAYAEAYFGLREGLETLFRRPVDLLTEPALENPYFRARVQAQRQRLFPPDGYATVDNELVWGVVEGHLLSLLRTLAHLLDSMDESPTTDTSPGGCAGQARA